MATARRSSTKLKAVSAKRRILVVEDEPTLRATVKSHLVRRGYDVEAVSDSESALRALKAQLPDLVFLDLHLPRESGYEVCETIRTQLRMSDLPIVLMGETTSPEARAFAEEAGASRCMNKPFTLRQLDAVVDLLLRATARKA